jgi:hypothetical protein
MFDDSGVIDLSEFEVYTDLDDVSFCWRDWRQAARMMAAWVI